MTTKEELAFTVDMHRHIAGEDMPIRLGHLAIWKLSVGNYKYNYRYELSLNMSFRHGTIKKVSGKRTAQEIIARILNKEISCQK